jgi:electron transfer flavoprotein beta subunit
MVPDTSEAEVKIDSTERNIVGSGLTFDINEADNYAVEEAMLIAEAGGGRVKVVSIASKEADVMIRMALAKGGESAVRVQDPRVNYRDPLQVAKVLAAVIKNEEFDLILTGCMSGDDKNMSVGVALAEELGVAHAAMVKNLEIAGDKVKVQRELEGGLLEVTEISLPAVLTIQTGINTPRYAPIRELRQAMKKELRICDLDELGIAENRVDEAGSKVELLKFYLPETVSNVQIIEGAPEEKAEQIAFKLIKGGLL